MHEIICPHCDKAFKVDESGYAEILKQVRDSDFERQLHERLELAEREKQNAVELAKANFSNDLEKTAAGKDAEIRELKSKLEASEVTQKLAVTEALSPVEKERDALAQAEHERKAASELAEALLASELHKVSAAKEDEIRELKAKLQGVELEKRLAVTEAVSAIEKERDELKNGIKQAELEKQLAEKALKDKYETQIKDRDDAIERLKDMKARLSTKMVDTTAPSRFTDTAGGFPTPARWRSRSRSSSSSRMP